MKDAVSYYDEFLVAIQKAEALYPMLKSCLDPPPQLNTIQQFLQKDAVEQGRILTSKDRKRLFAALQELNGFLHARLEMIGSSEQHELLMTNIPKRKQDVVQSYATAIQACTTALLDTQFVHLVLQNQSELYVTPPHSSCI